MAKGGMRDKMPTVAAWIDGLREVFGAEEIDTQIRKGMHGEPVFYASENGFEVGTPSPVRTRVQWDQRGIPYVVNGPEGGQDEQITKFDAKQRRDN